MGNNNWKALLKQKPGLFGVYLYLYCKMQNGKVGYIQGETITEIEEGSVEIPATLYIESEEMAQAILEAFSKQGIKLDKGHAEGKLEATEKHLEDMRRLVFKEPKVINIEQKNDKRN